MDGRTHIETLRSLYHHCREAFQLAQTLAESTDLDPDIRRCVQALPLVAECTCSAIADGWHLESADPLERYNIAPGG